MSAYHNIAWNDGSLGTIWGPCLDGRSDPCQCIACQNAEKIKASGLDFYQEYKKARVRNFDKFNEVQP